MNSTNPKKIKKEENWTDIAPHKNKYITTNGIRLNYLDYSGKGPTLILIHGYGDNPHLFDDLATAFTDKYHVIAYARRGHGKTEAKPPYDTATLTEDLRGLMDALNIKKAHLAGWSMGGNEITAMAGTYPERVDRIIYLEAGYDWSDSASVEAFKSMPSHMNATSDNLKSLDAYREYQSCKWLPTVSDGTRWEAYLRDLVVVQPDGSLRLAMGDDASQALFSTLLTDRRDYVKVHCPALAIYAETFLDVHNGDLNLAAENLDVERRFWAPFRVASVSRIRRELRGVEVVNVLGTHMDFVFTFRGAVVEAMRRFLD